MLFLDALATVSPAVPGERPEAGSGPGCRGLAEVGSQGLN